MATQKVTRITIRGQAITEGRFAFYFKEIGTQNLFQNKWWFTDTIPIGANLTYIYNELVAGNIYTYVNVPTPYAAEPPNFPTGSGYVKGWPVNAIAQTGANVNLFAKSPIITLTSDILGQKIVIEFCLNPARYQYWAEDKNGNQYLAQTFDDTTVNVAQEQGLSGFGTLMVTSDVTTYIRFNTTSQKSVTSNVKKNGEFYSSINWVVNSWFVGDSFIAEREDIGKQAQYFRIPVYAGDTLLSVRNRILYGESQSEANRYSGGVSCSSLESQLNTYFNAVGKKTKLIEENSWHVIADILTGTESLSQTALDEGVNIISGGNTNPFEVLSVRIYTVNEQVQHQISAYSYQANDFFMRTIVNQYFINDNIFELRSFYDLYGVDKPMGNQTASTDYKPLAYGFCFPLDIITEYNEEESSQIDITPIPGQSSAKAIGMDIAGAKRRITISGVRVDNSNIWTFHVPWQSNGVNQGIIYTGTSNWGWVKFMKAIIGCFQFMSGPYRLIMMTVPSSSQMQYFPTRDGAYQYSDGTYVIQAGWEDMCYVMIESFNYSRSEDMFNAIQYSLVLDRVYPLIPNR